MILYLQLINDPLEAFVTDPTAELKAAFPNEEVLSLDNYSEEWLVKNVIALSQTEENIKLIIFRQDTAEFKNLQPLIIQIPQFKNPVILYKGLATPLIQKMNSIKNIHLNILEENQDIITAAKLFFKD
ncbi:MAG: hypothetical protein ACNS60_13300 [Candidatus Cyclobacteriaceae bacterium M2_1C_046]